MPRTQLSDLDLDEVSLVDRPANQLAKVVLMKRDRCPMGKDCPMEKDDENCPHKECPMKMKKDLEKAVSGVKFIVGFKEGGGSEVQSVLFDSKKWNAETAKDWLKEHDFTSEKLDETEEKLRFRQKDPEGYSRLRTITPGSQIKKALGTESGLDDLQSEISASLRERHDGPVWVRDLVQDSVVYDHAGQTYQAPFTVTKGEDGSMEVTLEEAVLVEPVYQSATKSEPEKEAEVPVEVRMRLGKLQADALLLKYRIDKINSCHIPSGPSGGQFCAGGGGSSKSMQRYSNIREQHRGMREAAKGAGFKSSSMTGGGENMLATTREHMSHTSGLSLEIGRGPLPRDNFYALKDKQGKEIIGGSLPRNSSQRNEIQDSLMAMVKDSTR